MSCIVNRWPPWFRALYGGEWPSSYCCFDLETSGYEARQDVITQIGHVLVQDGEVVDELEMLLDWTGHPIVQDHWIRNRMSRLRSGMAAAGKPCHVTYERMRDEGIEPAKALRFYRDFFAALAGRDVVLVAHNGYQFDERMLEANLVGFGVAGSFAFGDNDLLDTDGIEKASQAVDDERCQPRAGDTLRSYFHRVRHSRLRGVYSNLDDHCRRKYRFADHGIGPGDMHGALVDSRCLRIMMEAYRAMLGPAPAVPPPSSAGESGRPPGPARAAAIRRPATAAVARPRRRGQRRR